MFDSRDSNLIIGEVRGAVETPVDVSNGEGGGGCAREVVGV